MSELIIDPPKKPRAPALPAHLEQRMERILQEQWIDNNLSGPDMLKHIHQEYGVLLTQSQLTNQIKKHGKQKSRVGCRPRDPPVLENDDSIEDSDPTAVDSDLDTTAQFNAREILEPARDSRNQRSDDLDRAAFTNPDHMGESESLPVADTPTSSERFSLVSETHQYERTVDLQVEHIDQNVICRPPSRSPLEKTTGIFSTLIFTPLRNIFGPSASHIRLLQRYSIAIACCGFSDEAARALELLYVYLLKHYRARADGSIRIGVVFEIVEALKQTLRMGLDRQNEKRIIRRCWTDSISKVFISDNIGMMRLTSRNILALRNLALAAFVHGHFQLYHELIYVLSYPGQPEVFTPAELSRLCSLARQNAGPSRSLEEKEICMEGMFASEHEQPAYQSCDDVWPVIKIVLLEMHDKLSSTSVIKVRGDYADLWHRAPSYGYFESLERWICLAYLCSQQWQHKEKLRSERRNLRKLPFRICQELESGDVPVLTVSVLLSLTHYPLWRVHSLERRDWRTRRAELVKGLLANQFVTVDSFNQIVNSPNLDVIQARILARDIVKLSKQVYCENPMTPEKYCEKSFDLIRETMVAGDEDEKETIQCSVVADRNMRDTPRSSWSSFRNFKRTGCRAIGQLSIRSSGSSYLYQSSLLGSSTGSLLGTLRRISKSYQTGELCFLATAYLLWRVAGHHRRRCNGY